jgi:hypothetical protein
MSIIGGGVDALTQLLAQRKLEEQQNMLRALAVADKQKQWQTDKERIRQADEGLALTKANQEELRRQGRVGQENVEYERQYRRAGNLAKTILPGESDEETFTQLKDMGFTGIVDKRPGAVLRLGTESNVGPIQTPGGTIAGARDVQTGDSFQSKGGSDWQLARAQAAERAEAQRIAQLGLSQRQEDKQEFDERMKMMDLQTRQMIAGMMAAARETARNTMTPNQEFNNSMKLAGSWDRAATGLREVRRQLGMMETGYAQLTNPNLDQRARNAGGQAIINTFNKILDPLSVVRESEYLRSIVGQSLIDRVQSYYDRTIDGGAGLTDKEQRLMVETARLFAQKYEQGLSGLRARTQSDAKQFGLRDPTVADFPAGGQGSGGVGVKIIEEIPSKGGK